VSLADRLRRFRPHRRPSVELVRLQPVEPAQVVEPLALPAPPRTCRRSAGLGALYAPVLDRDHYATGGQPGPTGRTPAHLDLDQIRQELYAPRTDWPDWREQRDS
jgi:hypothetical protein